MCLLVFRNLLILSSSGLCKVVAYIFWKNRCFFMDCVNTSVLNTLLIFLYLAMKNLTKCTPKLVEKVGQYKFNGKKLVTSATFFIRSDIPWYLKCMYVLHRTCFVFCSWMSNQNGNKSTTECVRMATPLCSKECKPASVLWQLHPPRYSKINFKDLI